MELEFQVQMKNDPVDINIVTANSETDLQEVIDQFIQDCKHIEKVTVADMEVKQWGLVETKKKERGAPVRMSFTESLKVLTGLLAKHVYHDISIKGFADDNDELNEIYLYCYSCKINLYNDTL